MSTDGGQTIGWTGRITAVGAITTAWDTAHAVIATMGDRFALVRTDSVGDGRHATGRKAISSTGPGKTMRKNLAAAAADLVTLARTGVEYDYRGGVIDAHAPEMPARFAKQLTQIVRGGAAIGIDRAAALRLAIRCARDSISRAIVWGRRSWFRLVAP